MSDEQALRERHRRTYDGGGLGDPRCAFDRFPWPCNAAKALALLDEERQDRVAEVEALTLTLLDVNEAHVEERALSDRLADAIRLFRQHGYDDGEMDDALAAHAAARKEGGT